MIDQRIRVDGTAHASAERRVRRWIEAGELTPLAGRVRVADLLATERKCDRAAAARVRARRLVSIPMQWRTRR